VQKFDVERFNLKNLMCGRQQYEVKISNKLAAFGNLGGGGVTINRTWESIERIQNLQPQPVRLL
jgi:hypothetical protein